MLCRLALTNWITMAMASSTIPLMWVAGKGDDNEEDLYFAGLRNDLDDDEDGLFDFPDDLVAVTPETMTRKRARRLANVVTDGMMMMTA